MPVQPWRVSALRLPISDDLSIDIPPLNWDDGMKLRQLLNDGGSDDIPAEADADELGKLCVGPDAWLVMQDAKPSFAVANRVTQAAVQYQVTLVMGQSAEAAIASAEKIWEAGLNPEAIAAAIAAAQTMSTPDSTDSTTSTSTDVDSETPTPASTSSTKSPKTTRQTSPKKKAASGRSPGTSSSAAGSSSAPTSPASTESISSDTPS